MTYKFETKLKTVVKIANLDNIIRKLRVFKQLGLEEQCKQKRLSKAKHDNKAIGILTTMKKYDTQNHVKNLNL